MCLLLLPPTRCVRQAYKLPNYERMRECELAVFAFILVFIFKRMQSYRSCPANAQLTFAVARDGSMPSNDCIIFNRNRKNAQFMSFKSHKTEQDKEKSAKVQCACAIYRCPHTDNEAKNSEKREKAKNEL